MTPEAKLVFIKALLDKLGVEADNLRYKTDPVPAIEGRASLDYALPVPKKAS